MLDWYLSYFSGIADIISRSYEVINYAFIVGAVLYLFGIDNSLYSYGFVAHMYYNNLVFPGLAMFSDLEGK